MHDKIGVTLREVFNRIASSHVPNKICFPMKRVPVSFLGWCKPQFKYHMADLVVYGRLEHFNVLVSVWMLTVNEDFTLP